MKWTVILLSASLLAGCTTSYKRTGEFKRENLSPDKTALVAVPEDGKYEKINYPGSGQTTANVICMAFAKNLKNVTVTDGKHSREENFARAAKDNFDYLVEPTILHWEDRATEWSGLQDRIDIDIKVYEVATKQNVASVIIRGKSSEWTLGGDKPEDLLTEPVNQYVYELFGKAPPPKTSAKKTLSPKQQ